MERSSKNTYIPEEPKQGNLTQTRKDTVYTNNGKGDIPFYTTIQKTNDKTEQREKKYKGSSDHKTILVHADEEDEKRKYEEKNSKKEKLEMVDL